MTVTYELIYKNTGDSDFSVHCSGYETESEAIIEAKKLFNCSFDLKHNPGMEVRVLKVRKTHSFSIKKYTPMVKK